MKWKLKRRISTSGNRYHDARKWSKFRFKAILFSLFGKNITSYKQYLENLFFSIGLETTVGLATFSARKEHTLFGVAFGWHATTVSWSIVAVILLISLFFIKRKIHSQYPKSLLCLSISSRRFLSLFWSLQRGFPKLFHHILIWVSHVKR